MLNRSTSSQPRAPRLEDVPGEYGWPLIGMTVRELRQPLAYSRYMLETYGSVYRTFTLLTKKVVVVGPEANEFFLLDREKNFSSKLGWTGYMENIFNRNLLLMDDEEHRVNRRWVQSAFSASALKDYYQILHEGFESAISQWPVNTPLRFYDRVKRSTLDQAANIFFGMKDEIRLPAINKAVTDMMLALTSFIRVPIPGLKYWNGIRGSRYMDRVLAEEVPRRRGADGGKDILSILCNIKDESGFAISDYEVVEHIKPFWMAAHDTISSSVSALTYELARNPQWQDRIRQELTADTNDFLAYERLNGLEKTEWALNEAMRLHPPVPSIPRVARADVTFCGRVIPKGTLVVVLLLLTHRMPQYWPDPDVFDPERFCPDRARNIPKLTFLPFGAGSHACLGRIFAYNSAKVILFQLLRRFRLRLLDDADPFYPIPISRPLNGLPVILTPL